MKSWVEVVVIVLLLRAFIVQAYVIPSPSMEDTLLMGDALLVNRFVYGIKTPFTMTQIFPGRMPKRNEIIVFKFPFENNDFIKRCVALPGDTVEVIDKILYVNHKQVDGPHIVHKDTITYPRIEVSQAEFQSVWEKAKASDYYYPSIRDNFGPVVVPKDYVFAMGDNRDNSFDSRFWGPLHKKYLKGKPLFIYFSFDFPGGRTILDVLMFWKWRSIRLARIGQLV